MNRIMLAVGILLSASLANAQVRWAPDRSVILGDGCKKGEAYFIVNGKDLSLIITNLLIDLPANGASQDLSQRRKCTARIPVEVDAGYYIANFKQHLSANVLKSKNATGSISCKSSVLGNTLTEVKIALPYGTQFGDSKSTKEITDVIDVIPSSEQCKNASQASKGFFATDIAISGSRDSSRENLIIGVTLESDTRMDLTTQTKSCFATTCTDNPPDNRFTCLEQAGWDKCGESWMQGYCDKSCGRCQ